MAKQLNVSLAFTANTDLAKKEIVDLQKALTNVTSFSKNNSKLFDVASIKEAEKAAKELSLHLMKATDINTGKINLSTFSASLKNSGNDLNSYRKKLEAIGPTGEKAFLQLSKSIANAESPLLRTNSKLKEFLTTLMNTARWQISSSILHGFMGAIQSAYGYAQDLNLSLNNIRIVTGYSSDEMARFAEQANKAALGLSTTTTKYTDAALIYYQQGIRDLEEIAARTETTIKLANVSRQSAEDVSSQMTAIWNNFDDGSKSLEYYADVITALGASTASSSQEIAKGMQLFAAVADTVGLSYEYAAASLATIVSVTRQSESTVGNGLRTIFSRLEGLKLGDTLEDGTDLNKYSLALATIGVDIKDTSGELKNMDTILEETASKWDQLDKAQKVAFATTVGGVRQYTNLIALLDNWDTVQENINTAKGSEGTLQKQADIYAESWEAAEKRVRAAAEEIYSSLLNDKFFIGVNDFFSTLLNGINGAIKGFGGLQGILLAIGSIFTQTYAKEVPIILDRIKEGLLVITGLANKDALENQKANLEIRQQEKQAAFDNVNRDAGSISYLAEVSGAELLALRKKELIQYLKEYNSLERATAELEIESLKEANELLLSKAKAYEEIEKKLNNRAELLNDKYLDRDVTAIAEFSKAAGVLDAVKNSISGFSTEVKTLLKDLKETSSNTDEVSEKSKEFAKNLKNIIDVAASVSNANDASWLNGFSKGIERDLTELEKHPEKLEEFLNKLENIKERASLIINRQSTQALNDINANITDSAGKAIPELLRFSRAYQENAKTGAEVVITAGRVGDSVSKLAPHLVTTSEVLTSTTSGLMSFASSLRSVKFTLNTFSNKDADSVDKIGAAIGLLTTSLMTFNNIGKMTRSIIAGYAGAQKAAELATKTMTAELKNLAIALAQANAVANANPYILGATIAIMAAATAIGFLAHLNQLLAEALKESAQKARELADEINKESEENAELTSSMKDLLARYKDGEDVKKELDSITDSLTEAYDVEGAAIARLTGNYEDYEAILDNVKLKKIELLDLQIADNKLAMDESGETLLNAAKGNWFSDNKLITSNGAYNFTLESSRGIAYQKDIHANEILQILQENIKSAEILYDADNGITFSIDDIKNNINLLASFYHELERTKDIINDLFKDEADYQSIINKEISEYIKSLDEEIKNYEPYALSYAAVTLRRNNSIDEVKSYKDYEKWIENVKSALSEAGHDDKFISGFIADEYKTATKEVKKFADAYLAVQDISKRSAVNKQNIADAFGAKEGYDASIAALMNWELLSDKTWKEAYEDAEKYNNALKDGAKATEDLAKTQSAVSDYGTKLTKSGSKKLAKDLDWGKTDEDGNEIIMKYSDFLLLSSEKLLSYLKKLEKEAAISAKESLKTLIEYEQKEFAKLKEWEASEQYKKDSKEKESAEKTLRDILQIRAAFAKEANTNKWSDEDKALLNEYGKNDAGITARNLTSFNENVSKEEDSARGTVQSYNNKIQDIEGLPEKINDLLKSYDNAAASEALMYETLNELNQAFINNSISSSDYLTALVTLASGYDNCTEELEKYKKALESNDVLAVKNAHDTLLLAIQTGELAKKYSIDAEELESFSKVIKDAGSEIDGLSDDVKKCDRECVEIAKDITRFDKAVVSVDKNFSKWQESLNGDNLQDIAASITGLEEAYGDLLDIDGSSLSANFLQDTENLDNMKKAIEGNEEAYNSLLDAARDDIWGQILEATPDTSGLTESMDYVRSCMEALDEAGINAGDDIYNALNEIPDPKLNPDAFIAACQAIADAATAAGMDAEEALTAAGIDAEVEPKTETVTESLGFDMIPKVETETVNAGKPEEVTIPTVTYEPKEVTGTRNMLAAGVKVTSAHKSAGGNVKFGNSSHASGNGRSGGKGSGGGGGKGSKAPKKKDLVVKKEKDKKRLEDEEERYHEINEELERTSHLLNMIGKEKDRTFGRNKIKNLNSENDLLKKQVGQYKELKKQAEAYRKTDALNLTKYGALIGSNGVINNYTEMLAAEVDRYNAAYDAYIDAQNKAIEEYNAKLVAGMEDAAKEAAEDELEAAKKAADAVWEKAKEYYDDFSKNVSKYEETVKKAEEAEESIREAENLVYDNDLQKITLIIELKIDIEDRDIALLQDYLEDIGDKADGAADAIANFGNQLDDTLNKVDHYTDEVSKILEHAGADDDLIDDVLNGTFDEDQWEDILSIGQDGKGLNEEEIDKLKSAADALLNMNKEMRRLREEALKKTGEAFDEFNEKLERGVSQIEHLTKVTQTYRDVLDIVGKNVLDRNGKLTSALNEQAYSIQRNHTHALLAQLDFIDSALDDAQRLYDEAVQNGYNQQVLDSLKADVEKYEDLRQSTYESWLDSWKEECQLAKNYYEDTLNQILQNFEDAIAGQFKNLSNLSEEFARKNEISSIYVEDYEKIYQLSKLTRDINNSLDDSTTLASKGKLRDILKEINALQESGLEVSQYDLDVLRKKYEMAIAYEQWQDAQNAKTVVRMQRDNEGNYGYVYTANLSDVEAAEQNYEDKLHEMQTLNAEYIQSLQEQIIQAQLNCADALSNLRAEDYASYEEYQAAVELIRSDYTERIQTLSQLMEKALDNNRNLYETDWTEYSKATGYKISADEEYIDKFEETVYSQLTGFLTMEEAQSAFVDAVNNASDAAAESWEDWYIRTNTALDDAGLSMLNFTDEVSDRVGELGEDAERAEEDVWNMSDEFADAYSNISDTVGNFLGEYSNYIDSMIDYNLALVDSINDVLRAYAELEGSEFDNNEDYYAEWESQKDANGNLIGWKAKDRNGNYITGSRTLDWEGNDQISGYRASYNFDSQGNLITQGRNAIGTGFAGTDFNDTTKNLYIIKTDTAVDPSVELIEKIADGVTNIATNQKYPGPPTGMASGGYTGEWGDSSGRLAILHEKELVLNSDDTANILSAVNMIRTISNAIDLNAIAAGAVFAGRGAAVVSSFGNDTLEQNVHITAEFPSVSDHNEIEEALNSLVERAAQFAGRKKF